MGCKPSAGVGFVPRNLRAQRGGIREANFRAQKLPIAYRDAALIQIPREIENVRFDGGSALRQCGMPSLIENAGQPLSVHFDLSGIHAVLREGRVTFRRNIRGGKPERSPHALAMRYDSRDFDKYSSLSRCDRKIL